MGEVVPWVYLQYLPQSFAGGVHPGVEGAFVHAENLRDVGDGEIVVVTEDDGEAMFFINVSRATTGHQPSFAETYSGARGSRRRTT